MTDMAPPSTLADSPTWAKTADTRRWTRFVSGLALALLGGLALVASFPPVGAWPLIFVAFVPIAIAQHRLLPPRWAGLAPMVGVGAYVSYLAWGGLSPLQRWWLLLLIPLLSATGGFDRRAHSQTSGQHLWWSSPALWTGALFAVGLTPIASWLDPAYALCRHPLLIQPVSVFAVSGLNLVILSPDPRPDRTDALFSSRCACAAADRFASRLWAPFSLGYLDV